MFSGGYTITLIEENPKKEIGFTCPSVSCGRSFTKPLSVVNLQLGPDVHYDACPYCLTKINRNDKTAALPVGKPRACHHHLGYLCDREKKTDVPDECLTCKDIVACMLGDLKK